MKVLVADDHDFFRLGLKAELSNIIPDANIFEARDTASVYDFLENNADVELAVLDLNMPGLNGHNFIQEVCETYPELKVLVITASEDADDIKFVMVSGAAAYISKTEGKDIVNQIILLVLSGGTYFPRQALIEPLANVSEISAHSNKTDIQKKISQLTARQKDVLRLLIQGNANKKIALILGLSENTIKIHMAAILKTMQLNSRAQVIAVVDESDIDNS